MAAIRLAQRADKAEEVLRLTITSTRAYWREVMRHKDEVHSIELEARDAREAVLQKAVEDARPDWYEHPVFVSVCTVAAVVAVASGTAALVDALTD